MNRISTSSTTRRTDLAGIGALLVAALLSIPPAASAVGNPEDVVRQVTDEVIAVLKQKQLPREQRQSQILAIVEHRVDFDTVSKLVLARHWKTLNEDQQRRFTQEFKEHLAVTYGQNVDSYHDQKVEIIGARDEARGDKTVQTHVAREGQKPFQVDYRVRQIGDEWKIIDVIVEGVSLVANFRSQFQQIMASGGIDQLLKLLHEKNVKGEAAPGAPGLKSPAK